MKIEQNSLLLLDNKGVYKIENLINSKIYIGSTTQSFLIRFRQHYTDLKRGCHKNDHLQYAWNKYKECNFEFTILESCNKDICFLREQHYLDFLNPMDPIIGYNINPNSTGTPNLSKETIIKRSITFSNTMKEAMIYYRKVKSTEIDIDQVPIKYLKIVNDKLIRPVWNKGLTKEDISYDYLLNIKKSVTTKVLESRKISANNRRNKSEKILVYNYKGKYLRNFRCISDIVDYSKTKHKLPLILRTTGRKGRELAASNIGSVCNGKIKQYKGLIFRFENSKLPIVPLVPSDIHRCWTKFKILTKI